MVGFRHLWWILTFETLWGVRIPHILTMPQRRVKYAAFAVLPGLPGDNLYSFFVGSDWREDKWSRTLRLLAFSLFGLAGYSLVAARIGAPMPQYISAKALEQLSPGQLGAFGAAFLGHVCGATFFGLVAGVGTRLLARLSAKSAYSSA